MIKKIAHFLNTWSAHIWLLPILLIYIFITPDNMTAKVQRLPGVSLVHEKLLAFLSRDDVF